MAKTLPGATREVHLARTPSQVLDYLETTLLSELNVLSPEVDREEMTAGGMTVPGSTVEAGPEGTATIHTGGGTMTGWIVSFTCHAVGEGTNVRVAVTQFMGGFLAKFGAKAQLAAYAENVAERLRAALA
jgi:hypothetical protein